MIIFQLLTVDEGLHLDMKRSQPRTLSINKSETERHPKELKWGSGLPWKLGRACGDSCQHLCISAMKPLQAWGRLRGRTPKSGRIPFTTFTIMCRMLFSPVKRSMRLTYGYWYTALRLAHGYLHNTLWLAYGHQFTTLWTAFDYQ